MHACVLREVVGVLVGVAQWSCPLHTPPLHSLIGPKLAAVGYAGLGLQQPHRFTAELMEQPDTGQHTLHASTYVLCACGHDALLSQSY